MKILSISDLSAAGGAAIAGNRISDALRTNGAEVIQLSSDGRNTDEQKALFNGKKFSALHDLLSPLIPASKAKSLTENNLNQQLRKFLQQQKFDAINIHNLHSAGWPISLVSTALEFAPVIWTLHDCWSFLGTFHSSYCNPASNYSKRILSKFWKSLELKQSINSLASVTPSKWLRGQATSSFWSEYAVKTINNPVPKSFLEQLDRESCKKALGISLDQPTVLCIAGNLNEEMKGGTILKEILNSDAKDYCQFFLIGEGNQFNDPKIRSLGFVKDELTLRIAYHAADVLLHPAQIDNLPNTVAESMSCGTPVLAFNTGGLPEMVISGKSGWLVPEMNAHLLAQELDSIVKSKSYKDLRNSTKELAEQLFAPKEIGMQYMEFIEGLVS